MAHQSRRRFKASFKAEVALGALRGDRTLQDLAKQRKIHPNLIAEWRRQLLEGAGSLFERGAPNEDEKVDVNELYLKIGQLRGLNIDRPNQVWATDITYLAHVGEMTAAPRRSPDRGPPH